MITLQDLKREYRKLYVDVLEKEQDRGYTTVNERRKLNKLQIAIKEGATMKDSIVNYNLTFVEKELTIDAIENYVKHLTDEGLKDNHDLVIKFKKIKTKLKEGSR